MVIVVTLTAAAVAVWRAPGTSPSMRSALRVGFAELLVGLGIGLVMIAGGRVVAAGGGPEAAFAFAAAFKPAHAVTLHGIVVLPGLAWLLSRRDRPERARLAAVRTAGAASVLLSGTAVVVGVLTA